MNKKNIEFVLLILVILYVIYSILPICAKEICNRNKLLKKYDEIEKSFEKNIGEYIILNSKLQGKDNIDIDLTGIEKGKFINIEDGIYGYIEYGNNCIQREYVEDKIKIKQGKCESIDDPKIAYEKIKQESKKDEFIPDENIDENYDYTSKYYFTGENPNNYLIFSNKCWRIVNVAQNNDVKLVYENEVNREGNCKNSSTNISGNIGLYTWDYRKNEYGTWEEKSSLQETMYYWQKDGIIDNKKFIMNLNNSNIKNAEWYAGEVSKETTNLSSVLKEERTTISDSKIGLLNSSDYLKISCGDKNNVRSNCNNKNYLFKEKYQWWTINSVKDEFKSVWMVMQDGVLKNVPVLLSHEYYFSGVRLSIYLDGNLKLVGNGTEINPYRLMSA